MTAGQPENPQAPVSHRRERVLRLSTILIPFVVFCYIWLPDFAAALTKWPIWIPAAVAAMLEMSGRRRRRRHGHGALLIWLIVVLALAEEPHSLLRAIRPPTPGHDLRVVTLNCATHSTISVKGARPGMPAAREVQKVGADIVLLQEAPPKVDIERLATDLYGKDAAVAIGLDTAIIAHGRLLSAGGGEDQDPFTASARVKLASGHTITVMSVHAAATPMGLMPWSPRIWREFAANRRVHRREMATVMRRLRGTPAIVAGDFNMPGYDPSLRRLRPRLYDSFRKAGRGWGDTIRTDIPVMRYDQIWLSPDLIARDVRAIRTHNTDHRMVVADIAIEPQQ